MGEAGNLGSEDELHSKLLSLLRSPPFAYRGQAISCIEGNDPVTDSETSDSEEFEEIVKTVQAYKVKARIIEVYVRRAWWTEERRDAYGKERAQ